MLLSPAIGVSTTVLPVFLLNRLGMPVSHFGLALFVVLAAGSLTFLWWRRPVLPFASYAPFAATFALAFLLTGWPLLLYGFDWLSYANDDMGNYVLGATRFFNHGFFDLPDTQTIASGRDYSLYYWFMHVPGQARPASELMIAWVMSLTGLMGYHVFMPLILGLQLVLISSAGALVCTGRGLHRAALVTCVLVSLSALTTLGVIYQLVGQVGGLALLAGAAALVFNGRGWRQVRPRAAVGEVAAMALVFAALVVWYPELVPFLGVAWILHLGALAMRRRLPSRSRIAMLVTAAAAGALLLGTYSVSAVVFLMQQVNKGQAPTDLELPIFPYFLVPSGVAYLWGFANIVALASEPWLSAGIALGGVLLIGSAVAALVLTWRGYASAALTLGMMVLAVRLFSQQFDFALFKLAMFVQPFLLGLASIVAVGGARRWTWRAIVPVVLAVLGLPGQAIYVDRASRNDWSAQVPYVSSSHLAAELDRLTQSAPTQLITDTANAALAKIEASATIGRPATFPSRNFFLEIAATFGDTQDPTNPDQLPKSVAMVQALDAQVVNTSFPMQLADGSSIDDPFSINIMDRSLGSPLACEVLLGSFGNQDILNRAAQTARTPTGLDVRPCQDVRNYLIFVDSKLGRNYSAVDPHHVGVYQLEQDPTRPGNTMAGVGRYLLFEVLNPTSSVRLGLSITTTLKGDGQNVLPLAAGIGETRQAFPLTGRGAAHVFTPPLAPRQIDGRYYVAVDMGVDGAQFANTRTGLMSLYGANVPLDTRSLVGFARDFSAISDAEYQALQPPSAIAKLPDDLTNRDLEYSGIYEDGWTSETAFFDLSQRDAQDELAVRGYIPLISGSVRTTIEISVDGSPLVSQPITEGEFEFHVPSLSIGRHRIALRFGMVQPLPSPDGRPVGGHLGFVGFVPPQSPITGDVIGTQAPLKLGANWHSLETYDGQAFRWVTNDAEIVLPTPDAKPHELSMELELGPGIGSAEMSLSLLDEQGTTLRQDWVRGREIVTLAIPADATSRLVRVRVDSRDVATPNDPRILNFRIFSLAWR